VRQGRPGALQTHQQEHFVQVFQMYLTHLRSGSACTSLQTPKKGCVRFCLCVVAVDLCLKSGLLAKVCSLRLHASPEGHAGLLSFRPATWAAWYNTWHLIRLTLKGAVVFLFFSGLLVFRSASAQVCKALYRIKMTLKMRSGGHLMQCYPPAMQSCCISLHSDDMCIYKCFCCAVQLHDHTEYPRVWLHMPWQCIVCTCLITTSTYTCVAYFVMSMFQTHC